MKTIEKFNPKFKLLAGGGPTNAHPDVLKVLSEPNMNHLDASIFDLIDDIKNMINVIVGSTDRLTLPLVGTASAALEACLSNCVFPDEQMVVCNNGFYGDRILEIARRYGLISHTLKFQPGKPVDPNTLDDYLKKHPNIKFVCIVHAESSTGVLSDISSIGKICRHYDRILLVDTVSSFGSVDLRHCEQYIDILFSNIQKTLSCPPGLSFVSLSPRVKNLVRTKKHVSRNWYYDFSMIIRCDQGINKRTFPYSTPVNLFYALHEALRLLLGEGIDTFIARHQDVNRKFYRALLDLGLVPFCDNNVRIPTISVFNIPAKFERQENAIRKLVEEKHNIVISTSFGELYSKLWRFGLMGHVCNDFHLNHCVSAFQKTFDELGLFKERRVLA